MELNTSAVTLIIKINIYYVLIRNLLVLGFLFVLKTLTCTDLVPRVALKEQSFKMGFLNLSWGLWN